MTPCPEIATFRHESGPIVTRWIAKFVETITPRKGVPYLDFMGIEFRAATQDDVIDAAHKFWADEQTKEEAKRAMIAGRMEKARAARKEIAG